MTQKIESTQNRQDDTETFTDLMPDAEGCIHGIKGIDPDVVQCDHCRLTLTRETDPLVTFLQRIRFHPKTRDGLRLCRTCRVAQYPDCDCDSCREDRTGSLYG